MSRNTYLRKWCLSEVMSRHFEKGGKCLSLLECTVLKSSANDKHSKYVKLSALKMVISDFFFTTEFEALIF